METGGAVKFGAAGYPDSLRCSQNTASFSLQWGNRGDRRIAAAAAGTERIKHAVRAKNAAFALISVYSGVIGYVHIFLRLFWAKYRLNLDLGHNVYERAKSKSKITN